MKLFGTEVPSLSRDKGTTGQAKNLAKGQDGPGQPKFGTGQAGIAKNQDGTWDKNRQTWTGRFGPKEGQRIFFLPFLLLPTLWSIASFQYHPQPVATIRVARVVVIQDNKGLYRGSSACAVFLRL